MLLLTGDFLKSVTFDDHQTAYFNGSRNGYIVAIDKKNATRDADELADGIVNQDVPVYLTTVYPDHDEDRETSTNLENWFSELEADIEEDNGFELASAVV